MESVSLIDSKLTNSNPLKVAFSIGVVQLVIYIEIFQKLPGSSLPSSGQSQKSSFTLSKLISFPVEIHLKC